MAPSTSQSWIFEESFLRSVPRKVPTGFGSWSLGLDADKFSAKSECAVIRALLVRDRCKTRYSAKNSSKTPERSSIDRSPLSIIAHRRCNTAVVDAGNIAVKKDSRLTLLANKVIHSTSQSVLHDVPTAIRAPKSLGPKTR